MPGPFRSAIGASVIGASVIGASLNGAVGFSAEAGADDRSHDWSGFAQNDTYPHQQLAELLQRMAPVNRTGAGTGAALYLCSTELAEILATGGTSNGTWVPRSAEPLEKTAASAVELCREEASALSKAVGPDEFAAIKSLMLQINAGLIERAWRKEAERPFPAPEQPAIPAG